MLNLSVRPDPVHRRITLDGLSQSSRATEGTVSRMTTIAIIKSDTRWFPDAYLGAWSRVELMQRAYRLAQVPYYACFLKGIACPSSLHVQCHGMMQQLSGGQAVTLLPGIFQNFNGMEVLLHTLSITAKLGIAGLLALLIKDAACLQSISAAYEEASKLFTL